jgi:hypothetical protein
VPERQRPKIPDAQLVVPRTAHQPLLVVLDAVNTVAVRCTGGHWNVYLQPSFLQKKYSGFNRYCQKMYRFQPVFTHFITKITQKWSENKTKQLKNYH